MWICTVPRCEHTSKVLRYGMRLKGSHSFTCTARIHLLMEWTIPAFSFPAETGPYSPTLEGWKAELPWSHCHKPSHISCILHRSGHL